MINLTGEKLVVNNIFQNNRSPPKNNRPPAQRACPKETTDRPALSKAAHVTCPEGMADCKAQEIGSRNKPTDIKKRLATIAAITTHTYKTSTVQRDAKSKNSATARPCKAQRKSRRNMRTHGSIEAKQGKDSPHTKAPARERGIAWGACDKAASFGIANSFIVAPEPQKRNL